MLAGNKVIITVALNGGMQQDREGAVIPKQPEEIGVAAARCYEAGASLVRIMLMGPEEYQSLNTDPGAVFAAKTATYYEARRFIVSTCADALKQLKAVTPADVVIEGNPRLTKVVRAAVRLAADHKLLLENCVREFSTAEPARDDL